MHRLLLLLGLALSVVLSADARANQRIRFDTTVRAIFWSGDGKTLAVGCDDGTVRLIDSKTGKETRRFSLGGSVYAVALSRDGKWLGVRQDTGSGSPPASIVDLGTGNRKKQLSKVYERYKTTELAFTAEGKTLMGAGPGARLRFENFNGGASASGGRGDFGSVAKDGSVIALGWANGRVALYDGMRSLGNLTVGNIAGLAVSPKGKTVAVAGQNREVILWDAGSKAKIARLEGLRANGSLLTFSGDGSMLGSFDRKNRVLMVWDMATHRLRQRVPVRQNDVTSILLSNEGRFVATAAKNHVDIWRASEDLSKLTPIDLDAKQLDQLWLDLAAEDFEKTNSALRKLAAGKKASIPFLESQVLEVASPKLDEARLQKLLADLDNDEFDVRESAQEEIATYGELAEDALQKLLVKTKSAEVKQRVRKLLVPIREPVLTPDRQRVLASLDLLEQIGTPTSRKALETIIEDALIPSIREEAKDALDRSQPVTEPGKSGD